MKRSRSENNNKASSAAFAALSLDRSAPLQAQLVAQLRAMILSGRAGQGARLPSSRALAAELGVSRVTTQAACDQLLAEGYVESRPRAGLFVVAVTPEARLTGRVAASAPPAPSPALPFDAGMPDMRAFPHRRWARLLERSWRDAGAALTARPDPAGWGPLRAAIAGHLNDWRDLPLAAEQVLVTSGAMEAAALLAAVAPPGPALLESPGHPAFARAFRALGRELIAVTPDASGIDPARLPPRAALLISTPGRQHPLGGSTPLPRRLALIDWAAKAGALLVEDDYDSEFRFRGRPLPAMAGLPGAERVVYLGSFSKLLSPHLRLGFLAAAPDLAARLAAAQAERGAQAGLAAQPALAAFIDQGDFGAHLRRMRRIYARRQAALTEGVARYCAGLLRMTPDESGLHGVAWLDGRLRRSDDRGAARVAAAHGLTAAPLSDFRWDGARGPGALILGFAAFDAAALDAACRRLEKALRSVTG